MNSFLLKALAVLMLIAGVLFSANESVVIAWEAGEPLKAIGRFLSAYLVAVIGALVFWLLAAFAACRERVAAHPRPTSAEAALTEE